MKTVVIWGRGVHTMKWIWAGFARAFTALGWAVEHRDDAPDGVNLPAEALVFAEGQEDHHLPHRPGWVYVLHNAHLTRYADVWPQTLALQVYTHDAIERDVRWLAPFIGHQAIPGTLGCLYQPWATDLLPDEIRVADAHLERQGYLAWCGTVGDGRFGNRQELTRFEAAHPQFPFVKRGGEVTPEEHRDFIRKAILAPTLTGRWQTTHGYLPCRAFKNVSYGQPCLTNSAAVAACLGLTPDEWHPDPARIPARVLYEHPHPKRTVELMTRVREQHTFVQRALTILEVARVG